MIHPSRIAILSIFLLLQTLTKAQNSEIIDKLDIKVESAGTFTDGDYAPFWLTSNSYGISSANRNKEYLRTGIFANKKLLNDKLDISIGFDILASHNLQSDLYVQQLYADFRYKILGLSVGMKERHNPHLNKQLSSGDLTLSDNARPIPQVEAGFPEFVTIPFTNGWLHVQGALSYGWFNDGGFKKRYAQDGNYATKVLYHRKYAYVKVEKNSPWSFMIGLQMDTQWGGHIYSKGEFLYSSPAKINDFFKVFIPMKGGGETNYADQANVQGNVYGGWYFAINYKKNDYSIKTYFQNFFEDHSGLIFKNIPDGIYGIEFNLNKKQIISSFLFEYIHTKNQSGPVLTPTWRDPDIPIMAVGEDDYYNHSGYVSETNYGHVLGNPLLTSPIYNDGRTLKVLNTRISAFHGGFGGYLTNDLSYRLLLTYSRSWGTYALPSRHTRNQFSSLVEGTYTPARLKNWLFSGAIAFDNSSSMVGDNFGFQLKLSKLFHIK